MRLALPVLAALAALGAAAPASADEQIVAGPPQRFVTATVTIDQGERVTLVNNDVDAHDVTAKAAGPDGNRLFRSRLASSGESVPVERTVFLTTGSYGFFCSVHPNMEGTLNVTSAGSPQPRPDTTAPRISLRLLDSRVSKALKRRALRVRVGSSEAATVRLTARARGRKLAGATVQLTKAGARTATLRLSKRSRRRLAKLRKSGRARVSVSAQATDKAGNSSAESTRKRLR